jgi:hypothetical protein
MLARLAGTTVSAILRSWHRIMLPGALLLLSGVSALTHRHVAVKCCSPVPDLEVLAELLLDTRVSNQDKFFVMRMMYGGARALMAFAIAAGLA